MTELRSIDGFASAVDAEVDQGGDAAFFDLSVAGAEQVTLQIRAMMDRAWEYIAVAYQGRAHLALGYESWDEYVDDRLGDLRLTVPREQRGAVVQSLSNAHMSLRAIAKVLGVSVATAYRDMSVGATEQDHDEETGLSTVQGRDGRQYRKRRRAMAPCTICGEVHVEAPDECPWDLFAQGRGPRPVRTATQSGTDTYISDSPDGRKAQESGNTAAGNRPLEGIVDSVTRAVCIVDELGLLPELVGELEVAVGSTDVIRSATGLATSIRELIDHLRLQTDAMAELIRRLERVARTD